MASGRRWRDGLSAAGFGRVFLSGITIIAALVLALFPAEANATAHADGGSR
jgi:hypothetical protein